MTNERTELLAIIRDEEHGAAANEIGRRIVEIQDRPDGQVRARFFAAAHVTAGSHLFALLTDARTAAEHLRRLADEIEATEARKH